MRPETLLLRALRAGPGYGLELAARVKEQSGVDLGPGSVYPALRDMERDGLVHSWETESMPQRGDHPRVMYELTGEGLRELTASENDAAFFGAILAHRISLHPWIRWQDVYWTDMARHWATRDLRIRAWLARWGAC